MGSILWPNRSISMLKYVVSYTFCSHVRCVTLISWVCEIPLPKTGLAHNHAQDLGLANKGSIVCNSWNISAYGPAKRCVVINRPLSCESYPWYVVYVCINVLRRDEYTLKLTIAQSNRKITWTDIGSKFLPAYQTKNLLQFKKDVTCCVFIYTGDIQRQNGNLYYLIWDSIYVSSYE